MVTAFVLLKANKSIVNTVAETLADLEGVSEVYSVSGAYDLLAAVSAHDSDSLAKVVTQRLLQVGGIVDSETLVASRVYSRHHLERMFSIGLEHEVGMYAVD